MPLILSTNYLCLFPQMFNHGHSQQHGSCIWVWRTFDSVRTCLHMEGHSSKTVHRPHLKSGCCLLATLWKTSSQHFWYKSGGTVLIFRVTFMEWRNVRYNETYFSGVNTRDKLVLSVWKVTKGTNVPHSPWESPKLFRSQQGS